MKNLKSILAIKVVIVTLIMIGFNSCASRKGHCDAYSNNSDIENSKDQIEANI